MLASAAGSIPPRERDASHGRQRSWPMTSAGPRRQLRSSKISLVRSGLWSCTPITSTAPLCRRWPPNTSLTSRCRSGTLPRRRRRSTCRWPGWGTAAAPSTTTTFRPATAATPRYWAVVAGKLDAGPAPRPDAANSRTTWLSTVNEDGSPHVTAVGALWVDGTFWFQTGAGTRKGRNVARDPRCSVAVSIRDADVVIEGDAVRVTEPGAVARIAKAWADNGWPAEPDESGSGITAPFNAPSQGPSPWHVYRIEPRSATVVLATDPGGLTRFRF